MIIYCSCDQSKPEDKQLGLMYGGKETFNSAQKKFLPSYVLRCKGCGMGTAPIQNLDSVPDWVKRV